jgi:hypothetical protein
LCWWVHSMAGWQLCIGAKLSKSRRKDRSKSSQIPRFIWTIWTTNTTAQPSKIGWGQSRKWFLITSIFHIPVAQLCRMNVGSVSSWRIS